MSRPPVMMTIGNTYQVPSTALNTQCVFRGGSGPFQDALPILASLALNLQPGALLALPSPPLITCFYGAACV